MQLTNIDVGVLIGFITSRCVEQQIKGGKVENLATGQLEELERLAKSEHSKNIVTDDIEIEQFGKLAKAKIPRVSIDMDGFKIGQYVT